MINVIVRHTFQIACCYAIATIAATFGVILAFSLDAMAPPVVVADCGPLMLAVVSVTYPAVLFARRYLPESYKLIPIGMGIGVLLGLPLLRIAMEARDGNISIADILHAVQTAIMSPMIIPAAAAAGAIAWFLSLPEVDYSGT